MPILLIHIGSFYLKLSFKMPKHAKEHVDFIKKFCICRFRKGKNLKPINNAVTTYLNLNKKKEDYSNIIKTIFWEDYSAENPDLPTMLCSKCRKKLAGTDPYFTMRPYYEGNYKYINA